MKTYLHISFHGFCSSCFNQPQLWTVATKPLTTKLAITKCPNTAMGPGIFSRTNSNAANKAVEFHYVPLRFLEHERTKYHVLVCSLQDELALLLSPVWTANTWKNNFRTKIAPMSIIVTVDMGPFQHPPKSQNIWDNKSHQKELVRDECQSMA